MKGYLWQVAAQGTFVMGFGRKVFRKPEAIWFADDLRARGYTDAHAQLFDAYRPLPPFALTLSVRGVR